VRTKVVADGLSMRNTEAMGLADIESNNGDSQSGYRDGKFWRMDDMQGVLIYHYLDGDVWLLMSTPNYNATSIRLFFGHAIKSRSFRNGCKCQVVIPGQ